MVELATVTVNNTIVGKCFGPGDLLQLVLLQLKKVSWTEMFCNCCVVYCHSCKLNHVLTAFIMDVTTNLNLYSILR